MQVLIIEDNITIAENVAIYLESKGHKTKSAHDGEIAFEMIEQEKFDFLIVDRMIPKIDGLSLVRLLQSRNITIPFLFLTALGKTVDRIEGLSLGANDYLVKPFDLEELFLRMENITAHRKGGGRAVKKWASNSIQIKNIIIDTAAKRILRDNQPLELAPKEYALIEYLAEYRGTVIDRDRLYEAVWGEFEPTFETLSTINVHIGRVRRKIGQDIIRTVKLEGFVIDAEI